MVREQAQENKSKISKQNLVIGSNKQIKILLRQKENFSTVTGEKEEFISLYLVAN